MDKRGVPGSLEGQKRLLTSLGAKDKVETSLAESSRRTTPVHNTAQQLDANKTEVEASKRASGLSKTPAKKEGKPAKEVENLMERLSVKDELPPVLKKKQKKKGKKTQEDLEGKPQKQRQVPTWTFKLVHKHGDLFECPPTEAMAHIVSRDMVMKKGIARTFKDMFGGVAELMSQEKDVGDVAILKAGESYIYYLVAKESCTDLPTYETLQSSLEAMKRDLMKRNVSRLSIPMIGCGLNRLKWNKVEKLLRELFRETNVTITVYECE